MVSLSHDLLNYSYTSTHATFVILLMKVSFHRYDYAVRIEYLYKK